MSVYALHPIMYQTPIFRALAARTTSDRPDLRVTVLFGDDLSLKATYFPEIGVTYKPDTPGLLRGYQSVFLRNYAKDSRGGFWSRLNPGIFKELVRRRSSVLVVHGYESLTAWLAMAGAKAMGIKVVWRGEVVGGRSGGRVRARVKKAALKMLLWSADAVCYSCSGNRRFFEDHGVRAGKLFFAPCAVDNEFFAHEAGRMKSQRAQARAELGIGQDDVVFVFCARLTARKRPMDLVKAAARLQDARVRILFVGDGPERLALERESVALGQTCIFTGFQNQSQIGHYYGVADAAVVCSDYDPSPKALNEAMNFSLPIIATRVIGTVPDLVRNRENGFVVPVGDIAALARAMSELVEDPARRGTMGQRSLDIVRDWSVEADADGLLAAVDFVLGRCNTAREQTAPNVPGAAGPRWA